MKEPLVILTGPTAVGKTALSIALAKAIDGEIISADSAQVYRYMDIGSAKITPEEMQGVVHHLIDILDPEEPFDVATFAQKAKEAIRDIRSRGHIPILVGGTGFYIQAVLYDIDFTEEEPTGLRSELEAFAKEHGANALHDRLRSVDPAAAEAIHPNNVRRVVRAIEFFEETGTRISEHNEQERAKESPYAFAYFVLNDDRARIYERIDRRVDLMMEAGLVSEVEMLRQRGCKRGMTSMQALGYKEILDYLDGSCSLDGAVNLIKRDSRHFAKRQLTWFRRERDVIWLQRDQLGSDDNILEYMTQMMRERRVID